MANFNKKIEKVISKYGIPITYKEDIDQTVFQVIFIAKGKPVTQSQTLVGDNNVHTFQIYATNGQRKWLQKGKFITTSLGDFIVRDCTIVLYKDEIICLKGTAENLIREEEYDH